MATAPSHKTMFAHERHTTIKKLVRTHRRLNFAQLQKLVSVSPATLRRDLATLEQDGHIVRVHGGVLDPTYVRAEVSFDERLVRNHSAKKHIAAEAVSRIPSGASVFIDAGSTCLEAGKMLLPRKDIRIITHSVALMALSLNGQAEFLCLGGELRRVSSALVGGHTLGALDSIQTDYAFIGATGMDHEGCSTTELTEADLKKHILQRANHTILLADSSKWKKPSTIRFATWKSVTEWITNQTLSAADKRVLRSHKVTLRIASSQADGG